MTQDEKTGAALVPTGLVAPLTEHTAPFCLCLYKDAHIEVPGRWKENGPPLSASCFCFRVRHFTVGVKMGLISFYIHPVFMLQ